ncbi:YbjN domain-containing protein [Candidatus Paracaedibacter symbiosus]|uniref:YbjN domain-containing protein n=1 Tax=Candidatus Paracaedibacter symbiosus TaxID=244582 RepID=UPI000509DFBA|nr:YbjN domain-containing protein [Candidatus Paracaedibacter symbiosus]
MQDALNPLMIIEAVADYNDWECNWLSDTEVAIVIPSLSISYEVHFIWEKEGGHLHLICFSNLEAEKNSSVDFLRLLMLANQKLWIGSFSVLENNIIAYRHVLHIKGVGANDFEALVDEAISIAIEESDSFFPGFEKVLQHGNLSSDDLDLLSLGVEGSA